MTKTKDAFALRDFDEKRILQRPYFRKLNLPVSTDENILRTFNVLTAATADAMEQKFEDLRKLNLAVQNYRRLIIKHRKRLRKFFNYYDEKGNREKSERAAGLLLKYNWFEEASELFNLKFGSLFINGEKEIDTQRRRDFSDRLRQARKESGMTQMQLAAKIGMTQGGYTQYENAGREPSLSTLAKLSRILKRPTDWLLGLA